MPITTHNLMGETRTFCISTKSDRELVLVSAYPQSGGSLPAIARILISGYWLQWGGNRLASKRCVYPESTLWADALALHYDEGQCCGLETVCSSLHILLHPVKTFCFKLKIIGSLTINMAVVEAFTDVKSSIYKCKVDDDANDESRESFALYFFLDQVVHLAKWQTNVGACN